MAIYAPHHKRALFGPGCGVTFAGVTVKTKTAPKKKPAARKRTARKTQLEKAEERNLIGSLKVHGRLIETDDEHSPLPPGVTHVLVSDEETDEPVLIERRKSFI